MLLKCFTSIYIFLSMFFFIVGSSKKFNTWTGDENVPVDVQEVGDVEVDQAGLADPTLGPLPAFLRTPCSQNM